MADDEYAILTANISGFSNKTIDGKNYGILRVRFDMTCEDSDTCLMYFMMVQCSGNWSYLLSVPVRICCNVFCVSGGEA